jgi:Patatin-like phospholipase
MGCGASRGAAADVTRVSPVEERGDSDRSSGSTEETGEPPLFADLSLFDPADAPKVENLVFEGGGPRGIAYVGGVLGEPGTFSNIKRVAGASAGSMVAMLLSLGATADDVQLVVGSLEPHRFADDSPGFIADVHRLRTRFGWNKGDYFLKTMRDIVAKFLGGDGRQTF